MPRLACTRCRIRVSDRTTAFIIRHAPIYAIHGLKMTGLGYSFDPTAARILQRLFLCTLLHKVRFLSRFWWVFIWLFGSSFTTLVRVCANPGHRLSTPGLRFINRVSHIHTKLLGKKLEALAVTCRDVKRIGLAQNRLDRH